MHDCAKFQAKIGIFHLMTPRLLQNRVVGVQSGADGQALISGGRPDPGSAEGGRREQLSVVDAIQSTTAAVTRSSPGTLWCSRFSRWKKTSSNRRGME